VLFLIAQGVPPEAICAITFTNKAAREMEERITNGLSLMANGTPYLGTFHALGARILRKESKLLGRTAGFVIFDNHDSLQVVKRQMKQLGMPLAKGRQSRGTPEGPAHFASRISAVKNGMELAEELLSSRKPEDIRFVELYKSYEQALRDQNAFDFDDLLSKIVVLFKKHPEVLEKYQRKFSHVLVDEYQDLNNIQYELIRMLAGHSGNVSVVGDWRQIIFSWRGSNPEIFTNFEKHWERARVVTLDENYRSSSNIITAASALFASQTEKQKQNLWTQNPEGEQVKLVEAVDEEDEAESIASAIADAMLDDNNNRDNGTTATPYTLRPTPSLTTAILYRTNAQSRAIEQALLRRNIPYEVYGGLKFYERREIKDIVAGLRYAANEKDEVSRERLEKTFSKTRFREFQSALANAEDKSPLALIKLFLAVTDYFDYMDRNYTNAFERRENIAELMRFASEFSELPPLLEQLSLLQATDMSANRESRIANCTNDTPSAISDKRSMVQLMTMHLAKGLEFDRVFVSGVCEGLLPHVRSLDTVEQLEEERRLLYVAMTRARHELILSFYDLPSRFLSEIPQELIKFESTSSDANTFEDGEDRYITLD
jgi:DNA helicase-2/ATP-dependent DNA helicase PcrA